MVERHSSEGWWIEWVGGKFNGLIRLSQKFKEAPDRFKDNAHTVGFLGGRQLGYVVRRLRREKVRYSCEEFQGCKGRC
jgi:hypothetical protein